MKYLLIEYVVSNAPTDLNDLNDLAGSGLFTLFNKECPPGTEFDTPAVKLG